MQTTIEYLAEVAIQANRMLNLIQAKYPEMQDELAYLTNIKTRATDLGYRKYADYNNSLYWKVCLPFARYLYDLNKSQLDQYKDLVNLGWKIANAAKMIDVSWYNGLSTSNANQQALF